MSIAFIPKKLNLEKLLKENPPGFKWHIDDFRYIIGTIVRMKATNKDYQEKEYVPLSSKILQGKLRNYNQCLKYLNDFGVIEINKQYIPGTKSRGYKIARAYGECVSDPVKLTKWSLVKADKEFVKAEKKFNKEYDYLIKWFQPPDLNIDVHGAEVFLQRLYSVEMEAGDTGALDKYYRRMDSINFLEKGIYYLHVDDNVKRFWSNLCNLKSELRNFISYRGQQLCSVDIKNSQPFFSILLFNPDFYEETGTHLKLKDLSTKIYHTLLPIIPTIQSILTSFIQSNYIMLVKSDESKASSNLELYCTLVDKGRLYSFISDRFFEETGARYNISVPEEKKKIKQAFFYTMYSPNNAFSDERGQMKRIFKELFPTVYKIFALIKKKNHSHLPVILQLIESEIVVRRTARTLSERYPEMPLYTIHDNIATLANDEAKNIVWGELKEQCRDIIGLQPSLHVDYWSSEGLI